MHSASLVHITPDTEKFIAYMARVSNPDNQNNPDSKGLIRYLITHKHWSPFEMANMCVEISTTRSIAAQILRHRSFSFQEFSTRYAAVISPAVTPKLRRQDTKNRQNSIDDMSESVTADFSSRIDEVFQASAGLYHDMLQAGIAKECAREVLPLATPTKLYMNGSIRSWLHYLDLRCGNGTQLEHRQVADSILEILYKEVPNVCVAMWGEG